MFIEHEPPDAFAAGAAEGERRIDDVLNPDQRVEHHRPAIVEIDEVGVHAWVLPVVGIPAIDAVLAWIPAARQPSPRLTCGDLRVLGKRELDHQLCHIYVRSVPQALDAHVDGNAVLSRLNDSVRRAGDSLRFPSASGRRSSGKGELVRPTGQFHSAVVDMGRFGP
jgi:hypothetical protein